MWQLAKNYFRAALAVWPIWVLGLYAIEIIVEKVVGFPENARGWKYHSLYHYESFAVESIALMAIAMLLLLRRATGNNPDRAFTIEIPLVIFAYLLLVSINGIFRTFQNYNMFILYYGVLLFFVPTLLLLGILIVLSSHWNRKFCRKPRMTTGSERHDSKGGTWKVVVAYLCVVIGTQLLYYLTSKLTVMLSLSTPFWGYFFSTYYSYTDFLSVAIDSILTWFHLANILVYLIIVTIGPFVLIAAVVLLLFHRILGPEPCRVYRMEIPVITLICLLFRMVNFMLMYSNTILSVFDCVVIMVIPPMITWLWTTVTAYCLIRIKNRLQL